MVSPAQHGSWLRNKRDKRSNPQSLSSHPPPSFALFAYFAVQSSSKPPFRRPTARVVVLLPLRSAGLKQEREGLSDTLSAHVALEEVRYVGPAHAVRAGGFECLVYGVGHGVPRGVSEDVTGAVFGVLPEGES